MSPPTVFASCVAKGSTSLMHSESSVSQCRSNTLSLRSSSSTSGLWHLSSNDAMALPPT